MSEQAPDNVFIMSDDDDDSEIGHAVDMESSKNAVELIDKSFALREIHIASPKNEQDDNKKFGRLQLNAAPSSDRTESSLSPFNSLQKKQIMIHVPQKHRPRTTCKLLSCCRKNRAAKWASKICWDWRCLLLMFLLLLGGVAVILYLFIFTFYIKISGQPVFTYLKKIVFATKALIFSAWCF